MRRETMMNVGMLLPGTSEYEAFLSRDQRIVYARYKDRLSDIYLLEQGQAETQREFTRGQLECMMPDCSARRLTTVSRSHSGRRDGFRHFAKGHGNHSPESLNHQQAKLAVASWISRRHPGLLVQLEQPVGARDRVADVLVTSVTSGKRMAIEIQYSGMSIAQWRERHESYASMDVADLSSNRIEYIQRRGTPASPLRDVRGARQRAVVMREASRAGADVDAAVDAGLSDLDRFQSTLW